jgi:hypothetical protein
MTEPAAVEATGLFDADWYARRYPDIAAAGVPPLEHYARHGEPEGRAPNAYFDPRSYIAAAGDIGNRSPLLHYAERGEAADIAPSALFDPGWYREAYRLPRSASALADFLRNRASRRVPAKDLFAVPHLPVYRDLPPTEDCFARYVEDCATTGRMPAPDSAIVAASGVFDENFYLINGSDVHEADLDPVAHFCNFGWQEGRQPNIYFATGWYVQTNPDVARLGINPLVHYLVTGEAAGRRPIVYFEPDWYRRAYSLEPGASPLAHFLRERRSQRFSPNSRFDVAWYAAQQGERLGRNRDPFAHFLQAATYDDIAPSAAFDPADYRRRHRGRRTRHFTWMLHPERDNSLVHALNADYR